MNIRFRIDSSTEKTSFIISINCTNQEMLGLGADLNGMDIDNRQETTKQLIEAINIMSGKSDFFYETKIEDKDKD